MLPMFSVCEVAMKLNPTSFIGRKFGRLTVVAAERRRTGIRNTTAIYLKALCECGNTTERPHTAFTTGNTRSCGCLHAESVKTSSRTHGKRSSPIWHIWQQMLQRCNNPSSGGYKKYGARGIQVCLEWHDFETFYADMGDRPEGMTLGRIDNDAGYSKENCRWETPAQQARNKRNTTMLVLDGKSVSLQDLADRHGVPARILRERLFRLGWPMEKALSTPALGKPWNKRDNAATVVAL